MAEEPKKRNEKGIMDKGWEQVQIKVRQIKIISF